MRLSIPRFWAVFLVVGLTGCLCAACATPNDGISRTAREFGVPRERVAKVAEELGVDPAEIEVFDSSIEFPYFFPYNYYKYQFELFEQERGRPPTRSEVEQFIKGYVARCAPSRFRIEYIYYSEQVHSGGEIAMVFAVSFQFPPPGEPEPEDLIFGGMYPIDLRDWSVNPPEERYWENCVEEYLSKH